MSQKGAPGAATEAARAQSSVEPESTPTAAYLTSLDALKGAIIDLTEWTPRVHSNGLDCAGADAVAAATNAALERVVELAGEGLFAVLDLIAVAEQPMRYDMNEILERLAKLEARETERETRTAKLEGQVEALQQVVTFCSRCASGTFLRRCRNADRR